MRRKRKQTAVESKKNYVPPRSMTKDEQEYYNKHKNLNGFSAIKTTNSNGKRNT